MSVTWATMKTYIQEGILKDDTADSRYTALQFAAYARWACAELSQHTARADEYVYQGDGTQSRFVLPSDLIDTVEKSGLVALVDTSSTRFIPPYKRLPEVSWPTDVTGLPREAYWEWPTGNLTLGFTPSASQKLVLNYFRIWHPPEQDDDLMEFPQWMEQPFVYLVAAMAMEPISVQAANVRQWNRKQDSGNPEHNPAQKQAKWFIEQAQRVLSKIAPQDRESFYLLNPRKPQR